MGKYLVLMFAHISIFFVVMGKYYVDIFAHNYFFYTFVAEK